MTKFDVAATRRGLKLWIAIAGLALTSCGGAEALEPQSDAAPPETLADDNSAEAETVEPVLDEANPWFSADSGGVFVQGLTAEMVEAGTGFEVGNVTLETGDNLAGPTISFAEGDVLVQMMTTGFSFSDMAAGQPESEIETVGDFDILVLGGLGAIVDFPEGPVTVSSFDFSKPNSGIDLARLIASARSEL